MLTMICIIVYMCAKGLHSTNQWAFIHRWQTITDLKKNSILQAANTVKPPYHGLDDILVKDMVLVSMQPGCY